MNTTEVSFDADHPVPDRYTPPPGEELDAIKEALSDGRLSGGAPVVAFYEQALARWFQVNRAIAVNSGTSALHATLTALEVKSGTEVLVPATAPLPTAMPILTRGATLVIVDTLPSSFALDPTDVERKLSVRTRAAITLPLWGYPNDDHAAAAVLTEAGVPVVEDACQAHGTREGGRYAGTGTAAGCFSTHDRKPLATGEGGFILASNPDLAERIDFYTPTSVTSKARSTASTTNSQPRWPRSDCAGCPGCTPSWRPAVAMPGVSSTGSHPTGFSTSFPTRTTTSRTTTTSS